MPTEILFEGSGFTVESVTATNLVTLRVTFTDSPLLVDEESADDALNVENYVLTDSNAEEYLIVGTNTVTGDTRSVDLFLAAPLTPGTWTLTASATIETPDGDTLAAPLAADFMVDSGMITSGITRGVENDDEEALLRKFLNPALRGPGWEALIAALAVGDAYNNENAQAAFDQLFLCTAGGTYLTRRAADYGVQKPEDVGFSDEIFSKYAIQITNNKLTEQSVLELMEIFYGSEATRAHATSGQVGPFILEDEDDLTIVLDGVEEINVVFTEDDFDAIGQARAAEVAAALTRAFDMNGLEAYAEEITDPETGDTSVRIYSASLGLRGSVQITGGKANNVLQFDTLLDLY